jgi:hypothetical protein
MKENYEVAAPIIAEAVLSGIQKIEDDLPKWWLYMNSRNNLLASKWYYGRRNLGAQEAIRLLDSGTSGPVVMPLGTDEKHVMLFLRAFCEVAYPVVQTDLFFGILESLKVEMLVQKPFAAALLIVHTIAKLFRDIDVQFHRLMMDELSLRARDRFLIKIGEKLVGIDDTEADKFLRSDAPLSMRMFFDYAVALTTSKKEVSPQKLTFATFLGFSLMKEIETFCAILNSLGIGGDFIALCDLYFNKVQNPAINYVREATTILQGRAIYGISMTPEGSFSVRPVSSGYGYPLSASFTFLLDSHLELEENDQDGSDTPDPTEE